jgi:hypothetical protein
LEDQGGDVAGDEDPVDELGLEAGEGEVDVVDSGKEAKRKGMVFCT